MATTTTRNRNSGILVQPYDSASSSSSLESRTTAARPSRIRFAPLPDPRRSVLVTEDGQELPIADDTHFPAAASLAVLAAGCASDEIAQQDENCSSSSNSYLSTSSSVPSSVASTPRTATPSDLDNKYSSPPSSVGSSPVAQNAALPAYPLKPTTSNNSPSNTTTTAPPSSWPKPRSLSLLRPFKRSSAASSSGSSSHSLTPTPSIDNAPTKDEKSSRKPISKEEILTLGTIHLFRTGSRDSTRSKENDSSTSGWGLSRWTSAGSAVGNNSASLLSGSSPLARTQSTQSYKSKSKRSMFSSSSSSSSSSLSDTTPPTTKAMSKSKSQPTTPTTPTASLPNRNRHKGTRMLNGRVYGGPKRPQTAGANPFANARDEEPEFVEWGYGGMGSVKGAKSAGVSMSGVDWARLQGGTAAVGNRTAVADKKEEVAEDGDDGSGMGWVKKRREEREKKAKEAKEKAERAAEEPTGSSMSTPTPTRSSTMDGTAFAAEASVSASAAAPVVVQYSAEPEDDAPSAAADVDTEDPSPESEGQRIPTPNASVLNAAALFGGMTPMNLTPAAEQSNPSLHSGLSRHDTGHVLQAVNVPMQAHAHAHGHRKHHSHSHSFSSGGHRRSASKSSVLGTAEDSAVLDEPKPVEDSSVLPIIEDIPVDIPTTPRPRSDSNSSTASSESSSEADDESDSDREEGAPRDDEDSESDEEEEDDEEEERRRKTALGAGVEKVSRHKE